MTDTTTDTSAATSPATSPEAGNQPSPVYAVEHGWLVEVTSECSGGGCGVYGHEPTCGLQPIGDVETLLTDARHGAHAVRALNAQVTAGLNATGPDDDNGPSVTVDGDWFRALVTEARDVRAAVEHTPDSDLGLPPAATIPTSDYDTGVLHRLMDAMGCKVEDDIPDGPCCEPPAACHGHPPIWYCHEHDWHDTDNSAGVCGYALMLARAVHPQTEQLS